MNLRLTLLFLLAFFAGGTVFAQDTIYTTDGSVIEARVKSKSAFLLNYYTYKGADSTPHQLQLSYVLGIHYADGRTWTRRSGETQERLERRAELRRIQRQVRRSYANVITFNFPIYHDIAHYPGIAVGVGYERFLDARSHLSVSVSIERAWAGTNAHGKLSPGEVRANIQSWHFAPGAFYHPAGNNKGYDLALGASFPLGSVRRNDTWYYNSQGSYKAPSTNLLAAALAEMNFSVHSPGHFVFTTSIAAGPLISAGETHGALVLFGIKWGGRF